MKTINNFKKISVFFIFVLVVSCKPTKTLKSNTEIIGRSAYDEYNAFGEYIWYRDSKGGISINKKNLKKIYAMTKKGNIEYFEFLEGYTAHLSRDKRRVAKSLNFSEITFVTAYCVENLYKCQKVISKNNFFKKYKFVNRFLGVNINKYNREFKKHDYYGLKLLKKHHLKHYKYFPDLDTIRYKKSISD